MAAVYSARPPQRSGELSRAGDVIGMSQEEDIMPAKSKAQQKAAGAALAAKRGEEKVSALRGASREMYKSMSENQLEEFAATKSKGKPEHVADKRH
jgi:hypothetical protein